MPALCGAVPVISVLVMRTPGTVKSRVRLAWSENGGGCPRKNDAMFGLVGILEGTGVFAHAEGRLGHVLRGAEVERCLRSFLLAGERRAAGAVGLFGAAALLIVEHEVGVDLPVDARGPDALVEEIGRLNGLLRLDVSLINRVIAVGVLDVQLVVLSTPFLAFCDYRLFCRRNHRKTALSP